MLLSKIYLVFATKPNRLDPRIHMLTVSNRFTYSNVPQFYEYFTVYLTSLSNIEFTQTKFSIYVNIHSITTC